MKPGFHLFHSVLLLYGWSNADAFDVRERLALAIPEAAARMTRFAIRFPLMSANYASVIVGLNNEDQVNPICDFVDRVKPDPDTVARIRALVGH